MKSLRKVIKSFSSSPVVILTQPPTTKFVAAGFINETVSDWPSWIEKQKQKEQGSTVIPKKGQYKDAISYELVDTVPKLLSVSRWHGKAYDYYIDNETDMVYFYPREGRSYNKLDERPDETKLLKKDGYHSMLHYESVKVMPKKQAMEQIKLEE